MMGHYFGYHGYAPIGCPRPQVRVVTECVDEHENDVKHMPWSSVTRSQPNWTLMGVSEVPETAFPTTINKTPKY